MNSWIDKPNKILINIKKKVTASMQNLTKGAFAVSVFPVLTHSAGAPP